MSCSTPVSIRRRIRRRGSPQDSPISPFVQKKSQEQEEEEFFLSQVPPTDDGVYWAFDNPELDEELYKKMRALDEASPTCRKKARSTPKFRLKLAGTLRQDNNNRNHDEEAKQFLTQCFGDFLNNKKQDKSALSESVVSEPKEVSNVFGEEDEEEAFLLLASQAVDSSFHNKKTPILLKKATPRHLTASDPFEDDSFDTLLSQLPDDTFGKSTPKVPPTKLSFKRHGTAEDFGTPRSTKSQERSSSFRRNNSAPVIESPAETTIPCTQEEIMRKKEAALKKRLFKQSGENPPALEPKMKEEIAKKKMEALRRRNLLQKNSQLGK